MTTSTRSARTRLGVSVASLAAIGALALSSGPAQAISPSQAPAATTAAAVGLSTGNPQAYCGIYWGSLAKSNARHLTTGTVEDVRAGRHTCYDRMVIDVDDVPGTLSYDVRYVNAVRRPGSGAKVPLAGDADLRVIVRAAAYDSHGRPTYSPADPNHVVNVSGYRTFRQIAVAGSFEGETTMGLGVRARLPFRVFVLDGPGDGARLVIDVAHRW